MQGHDFDEFVHATAPALTRAALLLTGDRHSADDLVQETLAKLFTHWRRVSRTTNHVAYAKTTMFRTFVSHRRLRRNSEQPRHIQEHEVVAHGPDLDLRITLRAALTKLSTLDRALVVMRYHDGRSSTEAADLLGLSPGAVRNRTMRALEQLRADLGDLEQMGLRPPTPTVRLLAPTRREP